MNLGEAKKKVLMILDEYTSNGTRSPDADIDKKMNAFFDMAQQDVSRVKGIVRRYLVPLAKDEEDAEFNPKAFFEYPMPEDFDRLIRVWADLQLTARGQWLGKSLILPGTEQRQIMVEYLAMPPRISDATPEDYEFELAADAQECMVLYVAAQQLAADLVLDNSKLWALYREALAKLSPPYESGGIEIIAASGSQQGGWLW